MPAELRAKLGAAAVQLRYLPRAWRLVRAAAGSWTLAWAGLLLANAAVPAAVVYLTKPLVDAIVAARGAGPEGWSTVLAWAIAMGAVLLVGAGLRAASAWVGSAQARRVEDHVGGLLQAQSTRVDLAFYEWPDFHDHLHRARQEARHRPVALLESCGAIVQNGITLAAMAVVLLSFSAWIAAALVVSALPALAVVVGSAVRQHRFRHRTTADERRATYQDWLMTSGEAAAEVRLFELAPTLRAAWSA